ncbi:MAG: hypothetical protein CMB82_05960 [Flammeovirgaceae bacterium]|nr:hypothetical protein [Flammeovirgaceae bacterium]
MKKTKNMMKNKILNPFKYLTMLVMALSLTFFTNCSDDDDVDDQLNDVVEQEYKDIMQTLTDVGGYDTLIYLLNSYPIDENGTLLSSLFSADGTYTLFAPNNDAFLALYATVGVSKATDVSPAIIVSLLTYHGAGTEITELTPGVSITTVQGEAIVVNKDNPDADGSEGSPEDGTLLTGSNTKGILVADTLIQASNGVIWDVGTVLIPPSIGDLLASILGTNAASLLIGETFSAMGGALQASEVFAVTNQLPSLIDFLANPEVMSTVFAVPNPVFQAAGLSVDAFSGQEWYGILSHHVVNEMSALEATNQDFKILDAAALTGGTFNDGKFVSGMFGVPDEETGEMGFLPLYIKYNADLAGQFGGGTGVLIDSDFDALEGMSEDSAGFWNAEVLFPDAAVNVNGVIHVIAGFLSPMRMDDDDDGNPMEGTWKLATVPGALAVGPSPTDFSWWSSTAATVEERGCLFDDQYVFDAGTMETNDDGDVIWKGEYTILHDGSTWLESFQGGGDGQCGEPVAPHDVSNAPFTYEVNEDKGTVTLFGIGAYFGLAKVYNDGELSDPADAPDQIRYTYVGDNEGVEEADHHATFHIQIPNEGGVDGFATWQFILENQDHEGPGDGTGNGDGTGGGDGGGQSPSIYADFTGTFGGMTFDSATYVYNFPTGSEAWAGVANNNVDLYPFSFPNGGTITFLAAIQTDGDSVNVNFRFEKAPNPDVDPAFNTANVLVTGTTGGTANDIEGTTYTVEIPPQDSANTYSSFLMYLVENDVPVEIHDVLVVENQ